MIRIFILKIYLFKIFINHWVQLNLPKTKRILVIQKGRHTSFYCFFKYVLDIVLLDWRVKKKIRF